ncbi:lysostaphin resistance A-like protein [Planctomycetota bacterium]
MIIAEANNQFAAQTSLADYIICTVGLIFFGYWLLKTSWGKNALADSPTRRNNIPLYLPFIPLIIWMSGISLAIAIAEKALPDLSNWQREFVNNMILCVCTIAGAVLILHLAETYFARRLKGLGLDFKKIHIDFGAAIINLVSIWPIILLVFVLTIYFGQYIHGPDFQVAQHEELRTIAANPQLQLRVLIIVTATIVVPIFEEMLFRGLFQTAIRRYLSRSAFFVRLQNRSLAAWVAIAISSVVFAIAHQKIGHWPALFVLGVSLGYSYERSGSLFRPIFIHLLFNASSIISTLYYG